jgi:hypothetical protein
MSNIAFVQGGTVKQLLWCALIYAIAVHPCAAQIKWVKWLPGDTSRSQFIVADKSGRTYVAGQFYGTVSIDNHALISRGDSDVFLLALDEDGDVEFVTSFGGPGIDSPTAIAAQPEGNVFVASRSVVETLLTNGDVVTATSASVTKFGNDGDIKWSQELQDTNATVASMMTEHGNNELWLCGFGSEGVFISARNKKGIEVFRRDTPLPLGVNFTLATLDEEHNAVLSGTWVGNPMLGDFEFWFSPPRPFHFFAKLGVGGQWLWTGTGLWSYRGNVYPSVAPASIALSATGDIFITGSATLPFTDLFVMKVEANAGGGEVIYATHGYRSVYAGTGIAIDRQGDFYASGYGIGYSLDPNRRWAAFVLGPDFQYEIRSVSRNDVIGARAICLDERKRIYVTGDFTGKAMFGSEPVGDVEGSPHHVFVMRIDDAIQRKN